MKKTFLLIALAALFVVGCQKETDNTTPSGSTNNDNTSTFDAWLINEGSMGTNAAELSRFNSATGEIEADWFSENLSRGLGDVANDIICHGGKIYIAVNGSNTVEILDARSGSSLKQISLDTRGPRYLAAHQGKVYVSCYDKSVARIDTLSLEIDANCTLTGMRPEQLCVLDNKLYVTSCWQYGACDVDYDSTVTVVDLATFTEVGKIPVGLNPGKIMAIDNSRFIVACAGDYGMVPAQTMIIDVNSRETQVLSIAATGMDLYNGYIYLYLTEYDEHWMPSAVFYKVDINTLQATPILSGYKSTLQNAYGIKVNPQNGDILVTNSPYGSNSDLYCFTAQGALRWQCEAREFASRIAFVQ